MLEIAPFRIKTLNFSRLVHLNWLAKTSGEGLGPLVVNIKIKLLLIAVVRMYCCTPNMLKETE